MLIIRSDTARFAGFPDLGQCRIQIGKRVCVGSRKSCGELRHQGKYRTRSENRSLQRLPMSHGQSHDDWHDRQGLKPALQNL
jgi:hypothetical protein